MAFLTALFVVSLVKKRTSAVETSIQPTDGMVFDHQDPIKDASDEADRAKKVRPKKAEKVAKVSRPKKTEKFQSDVVGVPIRKMLRGVKQYSLPSWFDPTKVDEDFVKNLINSFHWDCTTPEPRDMLQHFRDSKSFDFITTAMENNRKVFVSAIPVDINSVHHLIEVQETTKEFVSVDSLLFLLMVSQKRRLPSLLGKSALTSVNATSLSKNPEATPCALVCKKRLFQGKQRIKAYHKTMVYNTGLHGVKIVEELVLVSKEKA